MTTTTGTQTIQRHEEWAASNSSYALANRPSIQHRIHAKGSDSTLELGREEASDPLFLRVRRKSKDDLDRIAKNGASRKVQQFYRRQNNLIDDMLGPLDPEDEETKEKQMLKLKVAIYGSVIANIILFALQLVAAVTSGSLSIFATMADSFMDLLSSVVLMWTAKQASKLNPMKYPAGKARLETAGIIIESAQKLVSHNSEPDLSSMAIAFIAAALGVKLLLYLYCVTLSQYSSAKVLAQDHRNDLFVNSLGLTMGILGSRLAGWVDPIGSIVIALIILRSWVSTLIEHIQLIVGKSADTGFLQRVTYIALTHPGVQQVDTCRAYYAGNNLFVEVDIVLPPETPLRESHDIGEELQTKLESVPSVERAFVHVDYETSHKPEGQIDLFTFLSMQKPDDFKRIGIQRPNDCDLLCRFVRSLHTHLLNKGLTRSDSLVAFPRSTLRHDLKQEHQMLFQKALEAFDRYALPVLLSGMHVDFTQNKHQSSLLSTITDTTTVINAFDHHHQQEEEEDNDEEDDHTVDLLAISDTPYRQRQREEEASSLPHPQDMSRHDAMFHPNFARGMTTTLKQQQQQPQQYRRPMSMPVYLLEDSDIARVIIEEEGEDTDHPSAYAPPDYHDTALMKRWEKCRSCVIPREEEGREELPPYQCTVYKMGYVFIKREMDAPGIRSRWRSWRKLYAELWGTVLRIYRSAPNDMDRRLLSKWPFFSFHRGQQTLMSISLAGADASRALDYTKRPHSLRLTTAHGPQLLLRLPTNMEMISWVEHLQAAINISLDLEFRPMPKFITLPGRGLTATLNNSRAIELEQTREQRRRHQREILL
ncbi:hypothetical protein EC973_002538 [Apophysomyces ossiformis]|uniref:PH domain-containing protein n=1 Tax=Apophysomyces ossiformis TaxID=679940 RepID=A0A8H7BTM1_9FUNG|nr:hypothetical protein EC973_002538 [Apophysomyces ossiformis]